MTVHSNLGQGHQRRLAWFHGRAGETTHYPPPLDDGSFLVSRPKGIYKPADLQYAVSVRIQVDSPYRDGEIRHRLDGSWYFDYHQEGPDPAHRDDRYTNLGLMACIRDAVPVGVLKEIKVAVGARSEYRVLGLAIPVGWREGYFFFESVAGPGGPRGDTAEQILTDAAAADLDIDSASDPPADDYDARRRAYRQIVARRGQRNFRRQLMEAYESACAITGTSTECVLEAAHLRPYRGPESNVTSNGLLLRTDIHTLLDLQLIAVHPQKRTLLVSKLLQGSEYGALQGASVRGPRRALDQPAEEVLAGVLDAFHAAEAMR